MHMFDNERNSISIRVQVAALSEFAYHCDYFLLPDLPTERFPERVFQLSLYEILFLLWLLSTHLKLKNEMGVERIIFVHFPNSSSIA